MYLFFYLLYSCNYELISIKQINIVKNTKNLDIFSALIEWIINIPFLIMSMIMAIFQQSKSLDIEKDINNTISSNTILYSFVGISTILIFGSVFVNYYSEENIVLDAQEEEEEEEGICLDTEYVATELSPIEETNQEENQYLYFIIVCAIIGICIRIKKVIIYFKLRREQAQRKKAQIIQAISPVSLDDKYFDTKKYLIIPILIDVYDVKKHTSQITLLKCIIKLDSTVDEYQLKVIQDQFNKKLNELIIQNYDDVQDLLNNIIDIKNNPNSKLFCNIEEALNQILLTEVNFNLTIKVDENFDTKVLEKKFRTDNIFHSTSLNKKPDKSKDYIINFSTINIKRFHQVIENPLSEYTQSILIISYSTNEVRINNIKELINNKNIEKLKRYIKEARLFKYTYDYQGKENYQYQLKSAWNHHPKEEYQNYQHVIDVLQGGCNLENMSDNVDMYQLITKVTEEGKEIRQVYSKAIDTQDKNFISIYKIKKD